MEQHSSPGQFNQQPEPELTPEQYTDRLKKIFREDHDLTGVNAAWIGLPTALGQPDQYPKDGPGYLRKLGVPDALKVTKANVVDVGDIAPTQPTLGERMRSALSWGVNKRSTKDSAEGEVKNLNEIVEYSKKVMVKVREQLTAGRKVVSAGGDHSFAFATIAGALEQFKGDLGLIWIDAHADLNTPESSPTGNAHGMPVAHLMGLEGCNPKLTELISKGNHLKPENLIYIGLKDLDPKEIAYLDSLGIQHFVIEYSTEVNREEICRKIDDLQKRVGHMWCSTDLDSIDQSVAPGTRMRNKGGLSREMITSLAQYIGVTTKLAGVDVAEFAPKFDDKDDRTAKLVPELIARFLGGSKKLCSDGEGDELYSMNLNMSPKKVAVARKLGFVGSAVAAATIAAYEGALDKFKPLHEMAQNNSQSSQSAVYDESLAKGGIHVPKNGINFLSILTPEWTDDSGKNAVEIFKNGDFKKAAESYSSTDDTQTKDHVLSEMMTYIHAALLKSLDQAEKNRIWEAVAEIVGKNRAIELKGIYRGFLTNIDNKKIEALLKTLGTLPPG